MQTFLLFLSRLSLLFIDHFLFDYAVVRSISLSHCISHLRFGLPCFWINFLYCGLWLLFFFNWFYLDWCGFLNFYWGFNSLYWRLDQLNYYFFFELINFFCFLFFQPFNFIFLYLFHFLLHCFVNNR